MNMQIVRLLVVSSIIFQNGILYCINIRDDYIYRSIKFDII